LTIVGFQAHFLPALDALERSHFLEKKAQVENDYEDEGDSRSGIHLTADDVKTLMTSGRDVSLNLSSGQVLRIHRSGGDVQESLVKSSDPMSSDMKRRSDGFNASLERKKRLDADEVEERGVASKLNFSGVGEADDNARDAHSNISSVSGEGALVAVAVAVADSNFDSKTEASGNVSEDPATTKISGEAASDRIRYEGTVSMVSGTGRQYVLNVIEIDGVLWYLAIELRKQTAQGGSKFQNVASSSIPIADRKKVESADLATLKDCLGPDAPFGANASQLWLISKSYGFLFSCFFLFVFLKNERYADHKLTLKPN
jgi:hypothetical protein